METTAPRAPLSALALYDQAVAQFAPTGAHWLDYAALLRADAERFTGDAARKRIDRALDCEARARRGAAQTLRSVPRPDIACSVCGSLVFPHVCRPGRRS